MNPDDCIHRELDPHTGTVRCDILDKELGFKSIAGPGMSNYPCDRCHFGWVGGECPKVEDKSTWSPHLLELVQAIDTIGSGTSEVSLPSLSDMATNFYESMKKWKSSGFKTVTKEVFEQRKTICNECEHWDKKFFGRCKICGCFGVKLHLATEKCPDNPPRWE